MSRSFQNSPVSTRFNSNDPSQLSTPEDLSLTDYPDDNVTVLRFGRDEEFGFDDVDSDDVENDDVDSDDEYDSDGVGSDDVGSDGVDSDDVGSNNEYDDLDDEIASARHRRRSRTQTQGRRLVSEGKSGRRLVEEPEFAEPELVDPATVVGPLADLPPAADWRALAAAGHGISESRAAAAVFDRYSSYDTATHGPDPVPEWVVTSLSAFDNNLGIVKTGKEADVHLLERSVPERESCLLAVKTYRTSDHRMFHRDAGYTEGRRTRRSREGRAMAARTVFGKELMAGKWAAAEFAALSRLWQAGLPVPYPVQLIGSELMMEFLGSPDGVAAPRLANYSPGPDADSGVVFSALWADLVATLEHLAAMGLTHGDLSPYNVLVHPINGVLRCVLIDLPQIIDVIENPQGKMYLTRDAINVAEFFARRGVAAANGDLLALRLATEAGLVEPVT